jgi:hypothetical protein
MQEYAGMLVPNLWELMKFLLRISPKVAFSHPCLRPQGVNCRNLCPQTLRILHAGFSGDTLSYCYTHQYRLVYIHWHPALPLVSPVQCAVLRERVITTLRPKLYHSWPILTCLILVWLQLLANDSHGACKSYPDRIFACLVGRMTHS